MIKAKVIKNFHLDKFNELKNIERANLNKKEEGYLYKDDIFECTEEMAEYLSGKNPTTKAFIETIEIIPEKKGKIEIIEKKTIPRRRKKSVAKD